MRIFIAGAAGAVGRYLVPQLLEAGHDVVGSATSQSSAQRVAAMGAEPVVMDGLNAESARAAVLSARPDVVVHQMTALSSMSSMRNFDKVFHTTNRLRTEGTDHLLAAAREAGVRRFIAQSYTGWPNARTGGPVKTEDDPLETDPIRTSREGLAAIQHVERVVPAAEGMVGIVLRYGGFYGPGNALAPGGEMWEQVTAHKIPLIGDAGGIFSFVHTEYAAGAVLAAIERGDAGVYNIVDDEPAPVSEWLPELARIVGAKPPTRVPAWVARPLAGGFVVRMMTQGRGSSNAKARRELGWTPLHPTWREGFAELAAAGPGTVRAH